MLAGFKLYTQNISLLERLGLTIDILKAGLSQNGVFARRDAFSSMWTVSGSSEAKNLFLKSPNAALSLVCVSCGPHNAETLDEYELCFETADKLRMNLQIARFVPDFMLGAAAPGLR